MYLKSLPTRRSLDSQGTFRNTTLNPMSTSQKGTGQCSQHSLSISSQRFWQEVRLHASRGEERHDYIYQAGHSLKGSTGLSFHQRPSSFGTGTGTVPSSSHPLSSPGGGARPGPAVRRGKRVRSRGCLAGPELPLPLTEEQLRLSGLG